MDGRSGWETRAWRKMLRRVMGLEVSVLMGLEVSVLCAQKLLTLPEGLGRDPVEMYACPSNDR